MAISFQAVLPENNLVLEITRFSFESVGMNPLISGSGFF
jgi:hypothetical protein